MAFQELPDKVREGELELIQYWDDMDLLDKVTEDRPASRSYIFYEGPPTANGHPGIHHVIARTLKDMTCRYKTMKGYQVGRKAGFDTHGLPVEIEVEKELGLHDKKDIEAYGVERFNQKCRESVFRYGDEWVEMSQRMGYLIDMDHPYITLDNDYIESEWYMLKQFFDQGLLYKGAKIMPYCPRCGTGLASHEVAQGYQEDPVTTVTVKFKVRGRENDYFLAWTTTPWTLLSNLSLTVNPDINYVHFRQGGESYWVAEARLDEVVVKDYGPVEILEKKKGRELEYMEYEQLMPFIEVRDKAFYVTCADYVTTSDGTGIVHSAPAFGEDDYQTGRRYGLPLVNPINEEGIFQDGPYKGSFFQEADPQVIAWLKENGRLYSRQKITHKYPHCWRCGTPLIYYPRISWYINVQQFQDQMVAENKKVNWHPSYIGEKRFGNWLENINDWALSRTRYWGTPLNIWVCPDCGHQEAIGSRQELAEKAIEDIDEKLELHRPYVDQVHLRCPHCGGEMKREEDVIDVWFDSGAMPYAQWHYPFEHQEDFEGGRYPADFICEGVDQTRGWFYSLMAESVLFKGRAPYKNVLVNDLILDKNGQKMSKSKGNTIDPIMLFDEYGADAVRFYSLLVSPPWLPTRFDVDGLKEVNAKFFRTIKNVYAMFALYANTNGINPADLDVPLADRPVIDRWLISRYHSLLGDYDRNMEDFQYNRVVHAINDFVVEDLSNWYIRRSRNRFWSSDLSLEVKSVFRTSYEVLLGLSKLIAPITPFIAEQLYQRLMGEEAMASVHLEYLPEQEKEKIDQALEERMEVVRKMVNLGHASREKAEIKVRQPLQEIIVDKKFQPVIAGLEPLILEELNVKELVYSDQMAGMMDIELKPDYPKAGPVLGSRVKAFSRKLQEVDAHALLEEWEKGPVQLDIQGETLSIPREFVKAEYRARQGFDVEMDKGISIILETSLTEELIQEGYAREFISKVQQRRKANGYEVSDRIYIRLQADEEISQALKEQLATIKEETLCLRFNLVDQLEEEAVDINGHAVRFQLERAS